MASFTMASRIFNSVQNTVTIFPEFYADTDTDTDTDTETHTHTKKTLSLSLSYLYSLTLYYIQPLFIVSSSNPKTPSFSILLIHQSG